MVQTAPQPQADTSAQPTEKQDLDYVFHELTRSMCPECRRIIDGQVIIRDNKVYMRKRCPEHGWFEGLIYSDAEAYTASVKFNKPGTIPLDFSTEVVEGCPYDCGLCPEHKQHACLGIIEVNSACNFDCPLCFADAQSGFNLTLEEVDRILDRFIETEGQPEIVQFSGGEPSIHPQIVEMLRLAKDKGLPHVMLNTNGRRIARDDDFLAALADLDIFVYLQFDGFKEQTHQTLRAEENLLAEKKLALDRLHSIGKRVILVPAIDRNLNLDEVGEIVKFGLEHPAVRGINFQPVFHSGRHTTDHDPLQRVTNPDILQAIAEQTDGLFVKSDFVPIPCCFPTCNSVTYAYVEDDLVAPLPRMLEVEDYLDYLTNRTVPDVEGEIRKVLEDLWSTSSVAGSASVATQFQLACAACNLPMMDIGELADRVFMIMLTDFLDTYTFSLKNVMKCCKEILLPDGKQIPFCAYNNMGYREAARMQLAARERDRARARHIGDGDGAIIGEVEPLRFVPGPNGQGVVTPPELHERIVERYPRLANDHFTNGK